MRFSWVSAAAVALALAGAAEAAPNFVTWNFQSASTTGWIKLDLNGFSVDLGVDEHSGGKWMVDNSITSIKGYSKSIFASFHSPALQFTMGRDEGDLQDEVWIRLVRNLNGVNSYSLTLQGLNDEDYRQIRVLKLSIDDHQGLLSEIFDNPLGGLDIAQSINWSASNSTVSIMGAIVSGRTIAEDQVQVSVVRASIPEPTTLALAAVALIASLGMGVPRSKSRRI